MGASYACAECAEMDNEVTDFDRRSFSEIQSLVRGGKVQQLKNSEHKDSRSRPSTTLLSNKPLSFTARCRQLTHPAQRGGEHTDADVTVACPMLLGVADGVSQLTEFDIDPRQLPTELLGICEELAMESLLPDRMDERIDWMNDRTASSRSGHCCSSDAQVKARYSGPVSLLREAFESTASLGSLTLLLAIMDNSTRVHGQVHPMMAVLRIGDCELITLRRVNGQIKPLEVVFHTEVKRDKKCVKAPMSLSRMDERLDPEYNEDVSLEVIERGSRVQCTSVCEGDIVVLGTDGAFDNLFIEEIADICNMFMPPPEHSHFEPLNPAILSDIAEQIIRRAHAKTDSFTGILPDTPIGPGGKCDDTAIIVAEAVEWTEQQRQREYQQRRKMSHDADCCS